MSTFAFTRGDQAFVAAVYLNGKRHGLPTIDHARAKYYFEKSRVIVNFKSIFERCRVACFDKSYSVVSVYRRTGKSVSPPVVTVVNSVSPTLAGNSVCTKHHIGTAVVQLRFVVSLCCESKSALCHCRSDNCRCTSPIAAIGFVSVGVNDIAGIDIIQRARNESFVFFRNSCQRSRKTTHKQSSAQQNGEKSFFAKIFFHSKPP